MRFIKGYMRDEALRHELNQLTQDTFGFNFEDWFTNGYFQGDYIPYSYEEDGRLISNVSVNLMKFDRNGEIKNYIQIGTVMTAADCRMHGYAKELMEKAMADYEGKVDGIYLFGNPGALAFYDKLGFSRGLEYQYSLNENELGDLNWNKEHVGKEVFIKVNPKDEEQKKYYLETIKNAAVNSAFEHVNKYGLQMFYTAGMDDIYYCREMDCFIVYEMQEDILHLNSIICRSKVNLMEILKRITEPYDNVILGFTPCKEEQSHFTAEVFSGGDDYVLFYRGEDLEKMEKEKLYFPEFSHA